MKALRVLYTDNLFFYFIISFVLFGLGYSFFNDVSNYLDSNSDAAFYLFVVENGYPPDDTDHRAGRILIPKLVSIIYHYSQDLVGSWDPSKFSFFVVNSLFIILSIVLYRKIMRSFDYSDKLIKIAALLYVSSFASTNYFIRGSVDPGEIFFLAALTFSLLTNRLGFTPFIFVLGVSNRETFLAVGTVMFFADMLYDYFWKKVPLISMFFKLAMLCVSIIAAIATHIGIQFYIVGDFITPLNSFNKFNDLPEWQNSRSIVEEVRRFLYVFLVPIVCFFLSPVKLPVRIVLHLVAVSSIVLFGSFIASTSGTGLSRYLFSGAGFYLSLMVASCIFPTENKCIN